MTTPHDAEWLEHDDDSRPVRVTSRAGTATDRADAETAWDILTNDVVHATGCPYVAPDADGDGGVECECYVARLSDALARLAAQHTDTERTTCPDGGTCHHECESVVKCFRVACCEPLSGVFPDDRWPAQVRAEAAEARVVALEAHTQRLETAIRAWTYDHGDDGPCGCSLCAALAAAEGDTTTPEGEGDA